MSPLRRFAAGALAAALRTPPEAGDVLPQLEEISVALISDRAMADFHMSFMGISGPTDVLTFEQGEILISTETAARYAVDYGHSPLEEIAVYLLHGLLHLRGYDDQTPQSHSEMHRVQNDIFTELRPLLS